MSKLSSLQCPRLRPVEAFPVRVNGDDYICLRDPVSLAEQQIFLNNQVAFLVSRMDGSRSLRDIQAEFLRASGEILPLENVETLVRQLDKYRYLDSPSFRSYCEDLAEKFRNAPSRPAHHAGSAYEGDEEALMTQIECFFTHSEGPGPLLPASSQAPPLRGLIAPHIDFKRGAPTYAHAYKALAEHPGADRFIIFGTAHAPMKLRFALTSKNYDTPLGSAETDKKFVDRLQSRLKTDYFCDEFAHRAEHSIEFQAVLLRYLLRRRSFKIVPILTGSFHDIISTGKAGRENSEVQAMVDAVTETMAETRGRFCVIAGADLAHIGRHFGDPSGPTETSLGEIEREDRVFLDLVAGGDAEGMLRTISADNDRRHVCGYPPIYMALRCMGKARGKLLQYRQWSDLTAGAAVTYAAVAFS